MRWPALLLIAIAALTLSPALPAQDGPAAVLEFIEVSEADRGTPAGAELAAAQEDFRRSLSEDPERALESAKRIVALTTEVYGESHDAVARALTNLAIVQAEAANFSAAVENYTAAIRLREGASGTIVTRDLINPLRGLASAHIALDQVERAIPAYERAIHVSHVNDGPNNFDQIEDIEALSRAFYFSGDLDKADDMQDAVFRLRERRSEDNPDQYLDALEQRAVWHSRLGDPAKAFRVYRRMVREASREYGRDDVRLIEPLVAMAHVAVETAEDDRLGSRFSVGRRGRWNPDTGFGSTARAQLELQRLCRLGACQGSLVHRRIQSGGIGPAGEQAFRDGIRAMGRAVRIAREHEDEDPARLARTLVEQGDWLTSMNQGQQARRPYREAWRLLHADPGLHGVRDELFSAPVPVKRIDLPRVYGERSEKRAALAGDLQRGHADVAFETDRLGRPRNVRIVSANPAGLIDTRLKRKVRQFRFRPVFRDGEPKSSANLTYRHVFRYDESELSEKDRKIIAKTTYEQDAAPDAAASLSVNLDVGLGDPTPPELSANAGRGEATPEAAPPPVQDGARVGNNGAGPEGNAEAGSTPEELPAQDAERR